MPPFYEFSVASFTGPGITPHPHEHHDVAVPAIPANEYHSRGGFTTEGYVTGIHSANVGWTGAYTHWYPIDPITREPISSTYRDAPDREIKALFMPASHIAEAVVPSNDIIPLIAYHSLGMEVNDVMPTQDIMGSAEAHPTESTVHSCLATTLCQWAGEGCHEACGADITCESVPAHFRHTHGINKLRADTPIYCSWEGCQRWLKRKSFVRHVRERHLDHPRKHK